MQYEELEVYIERRFGTKANFARHMGVYPQQVQTWVNKGYWVINDVMVKPMYEIFAEDEQC